MKTSKALIVNPQPITKMVSSWQLEMVEDIEKAIEKLFHKTYKVLAISEEASPSDFAKAKKMIGMIQPETLVIKIAMQGDVEAQIKTAFYQNKFSNQGYQVLDNSFEIALSQALKQHNLLN